MQKITCPYCKRPINEEARFCSFCGKSLDVKDEADAIGSSFRKDVETVVKAIGEFVSWMVKTKKNPKFMKAYREKLKCEIDPMITELGRSPSLSTNDNPFIFSTIQEAVSELKDPLQFMEAKLRPSVGMGVYLERWMMNKVVEDYLKECAVKVTRLLDKITMNPTP